MVARVLFAVGAVLAGTVAAGARSQESSDLCARFAEVELGGTIAEPRLIELSGLAGSRQWPDVLWGHNDSGGAPELYAFAEDGTSLGTYPVDGADAVDWEDLASGPDAAGTDVLYVGDIGDNAAERSSVTLYRLHEPREAPVAPGVALADVDRIDLSYPSGPADAEALLIDPRTGDLVIVTKSLAGRSQVLTAPASALTSDAPVTLDDAGALSVPSPQDSGPGLPATMVTGGDVSPDGSIVLLRTYQSVLAFDRADHQTVAEALLGEPCFAPQEQEEQGEAIAFTGDGAAYVTASEGSNVSIHRVEVGAPAPTTPTTSSEASEPAGEVADDRSAVATALVAGGVVLVVVGAGAVLWSRRRRGRRSAG